jgi:predicted dithiol-disulfide oxidoreductase (DUF899 family)
MAKKAGSAKAKSAANTRKPKVAVSKPKAKQLRPVSALVKKNKMAFPGERPAYRKARNKLLAREIALRREMEEVAALRRALPKGGAVKSDYIFDEWDAKGSLVQTRLSELFADGKDTLVIYNFMFPRYSTDDRAGPAAGATAQLDKKDMPCPSCVAFIDQLDGAAEHFAAAGFNFAVVAKTPIQRLATFCRERGWRHLRFLSAASNSFKHDYHAETPEGEQMPMMTVFHRDNGVMRHSWSSELFYLDPDPGQDPRHNGTLEPLYNLMDLTPERRPKKWQEQLQYAEKGATSVSGAR